jgi:hypothetical protein
MMSGIGIGESDFKRLRIRENYYIDKTMYIKHIIDNESRMLLVTRPRRFGKTLNMSTLRYYFDINGKDTKDLFKGLKIMEQAEKYTSKMASYPCIYMTLKDLGQVNYQNMLLALQIALVEIFIENVFLLESNKLIAIEKEMFNKVLNMKANEIELSNALNLLIKLLYKHYERPVMLFLDEYDVPLQSAYVEGYYDQAIKFFKTFYELHLKITLI